uniref:Uncharacterized protein LOC102804488 n=1 Tax=Saccoglossus kowalevskii TaxID=10224 RepID=A0ABM0ML66_SACKO|nr:PREDICTED: uncharacterized protein LOC102804488 [Saccoglossus kowalevskii]
MDVDDLLVRKRPLSNSDTESTCPAKQQRVESVALHTSGADTTTNTTDISGHASQIHTILQNRFLGPAGVMYTMEPVAKKSVGTPAGNKGLAVDSTVSTGNDAVSVEVDMTNAVQEQNVSVVLRTNAYMKDSNGQATENKPTDSRSQATENKPTDSRSQAMDNKPTDSNGHAVDNKPIDSSGVMSGDCEGCRESVPFVFEHFSKIKNVHRVTFSDLKTAPYKCPDCVYETSIDVMLLSHHYAQFHGGYKCPQCETVSCDAANLKLHLDSKHLVI